MKRTFIKDFAYSGYREGDAYADKRSILITNYISIFLIFALVITFILRKLFFTHITSSDFSISYLSLGVVLMLIPIFLNRIYFTTLSRILLCVLPIGFLWYVYISEIQSSHLPEISMYDGLRVHLLAMSIIPFLVFDKRKTLYLIGAILPSFISVVFFERILGFFNIGLQQVGIESMDYDMMLLRTIISYLLISLGSYTFHSIIKNNDEINEKIQTELNQKSEELTIQNVKLHDSKIRLKEMNQHLNFLVDKKTHDIKLQNQKLMSYAHFNAHKVRAPLARLLGLINLCKLDHEMDHDHLIQLFGHEIDDLNHRINMVTKELNEIELFDNQH